MPKRRAKSSKPPSKMVIDSVRSLVAPPDAEVHVMQDDLDWYDRRKAAIAAAHPPKPSEHSEGFDEKLAKEWEEFGKSEG